MSNAKKGANVKSQKKPAKPKAKKDEALQNIEMIFEKMDLNHDGRISVHELTKAAQLIGMNPTRKEAEQMIADCNPSQKGYVNFTEFKRIFDQRQHEIDAQVDEIRKAFAVFDKDNSGTISKDEIRAVLCKCGEHIPEEEIDEMLKMVDADGDGNIDIDGTSKPGLVWERVKEAGGDGNIDIDEFAMVMCETDLG